MESQQHLRTNWIVLLVAATVLALSVLWEIWNRMAQAWPSALPYVLGGASLLVIVAPGVLAVVSKRRPAAEGG